MYMRPYRPGLISAINRFWPKLSLTGVLQSGDEVIMCVHFVQYSCIWHAGLLHGKKWSGFLALSKIWIIELKKFVCICVIILLHHFCEKKILAKIFTYGSLASRWRYVGAYGTPILGGRKIRICETLLKNIPTH